MRKKDMDKVAAVKQAVYDITINEGYQNLSMSKIAKKAGVSQATIYLTYESKEDMLTSIYVEAKDILDSQTKVDLDPATDIETKLKQLFTNYVKTLLAHPEQALYMDAVNNTPELIERNVYQEMMHRNDDIQALVTAGQKAGTLAKVPFPLLVAFTFDSINSWMKVAYSHHVEPDEDQITTAVALCWKVMKA
ncbi:TetR/AcrR family transcriptional regulator [Secundilactobacillus collinoides]|uniref:Transcriptional regulator n=2 Tax=Secundilactobacillus collinoides TaxID=33960 RepID=A0A0R2B6W4_SECCO|nr:TetR/AcrR family transcriptional regulator [Secundilactobacillus collinoides]KRM74903.1 transcriptional regulator [Secundilactobacillus collinoides DSM 20515 = JCM 1123]